MSTVVSGGSGRGDRRGFSTGVVTGLSRSYLGKRRGGVFLAKGMAYAKALRLERA